MLREDDLRTFSSLFVSARDKNVHSERPPSETLQVDQGGIFASEVWRLSRSMQIAALAGAIPEEQAISVTAIAAATNGVKCAQLDNVDAWEKAIGWSMHRSMEEFPTHQPSEWYARQRNVGEACRRLKDLGYEISFNSYGPVLEERVQKSIVGRISLLLSGLDGLNNLSSIFEILTNSNFVYDAMWLFGNRVPNFQDRSEAAVPWGWLLSLAMKYISVRQSSNTPNEDWRELILLSIDFASVFDCQRYGQFEDHNLPPAEINRALKDSLFWKELFSLPQVPPRYVRHLFAALMQCLSAEDRKRFDFPIENLLTEISNALVHSRNNTPSLHAAAPVRRASPILWQIARGNIGEINAQYSAPFDANQRNQDDYIFFERDHDVIMMMPRSLLSNAACEIVFKLIWRKLEPSRAKSVVGSTFERVIANACVGKAPQVYSGEKYKVKKQKFEIDVATRNSNQIAILEMKGKSLTTSSRAGDMMDFISDYTKSFLTLLKQLARHEVNLRSGLTPLTVRDEQVSALIPLKIAVSPLSFGPVSDKLLTSSLIISMLNINLTPVSTEDKHATICNQFNIAKNEAVKHIIEVCPKENGEYDLFAYLMDVFWLDLGQVYYLLERSVDSWSGLSVLRNMTYSTRDFWTELATADRQGLFQGKLNPTTGSIDL